MCSIWWNGYRIDGGRWLHQVHLFKKVCPTAQPILETFVFGFLGIITGGRKLYRTQLVHRCPFSTSTYSDPGLLEWMGCVNAPLLVECSTIIPMKISRYHWQLLTPRHRCLSRYNCILCLTRYGIYLGLPKNNKDMYRLPGTALKSFWESPLGMYTLSWPSDTRSGEN